MTKNRYATSEYSHAELIYRLRQERRNMKYEEAQELLYKTKWKTSCCRQGKQCWCRIIEPVRKIKYDDNSEGLYIAGSGEINKRAAEYIVKLHNEHLDRINKQ